MYLLKYLDTHPRFHLQEILLDKKLNDLNQIVSDSCFSWDMLWKPSCMKAWLDRSLGLLFAAGATKSTLLHSEQFCLLLIWKCPLLFKDNNVVPVSNNAELVFIWQYYSVEALIIVIVNE